MYLLNVFIKADAVKWSKVKPFFSGAGHTPRTQDFIVAWVGSALNLKTWKFATAHFMKTRLQMKDYVFMWYAKPRPALPAGQLPGINYAVGIFM